MIKKLTKQGDEWVLVLDRALLDQLEIDEQTELEVTTAGRTLLVSPLADRGLSAERFQELVESINQRYAKTFKRLAEES